MLLECLEAIEEGLCRIVYEPDTLQNKCLYWIMRSLHILLTREVKKDDNRKS